MKLVKEKVEDHSQILKYLINPRAMQKQLGLLNLVMIKTAKMFSFWDRKNRERAWENICQKKKKNVKVKRKIG